MSRHPHIFPETFTMKELLSTSILALVCPVELVEEVLEKTGKNSKRERLLPAIALVYFIMALTLWREMPTEEVYRVIMEDLNYLDISSVGAQKICKASISQARTKLGSDVMHLLADEVLSPLASPSQPGAWFNGLRVMALDGTTLDLPDENEIDKYFGRPSSRSGESAFPQARLLALLETGTHAITGAEIGPYRTSEVKLAKRLLPDKLQSDMLVLADRNFYSYHLWNTSSEISNLLWRVKSNLILPVDKRLSDGSYFSKVYDSRNKINCVPIKVRVIEYTLIDSEDQNEIYRLLTTLFDHKISPAEDLASLYHERWEAESCLGEVKIGQKGFSTLIRSKTPELIKQEIWGLLLTHFAIRSLMYKASRKKKLDTDELSFKNSVRIIKRKLPHIAAFPPFT
ncbi:MAG: IS4 family transposase [Deltaproteobacteria bacterium]|jgi:hypothetical protein|nr:IS4 family transposase [Deltaproteobacteria bacterium]